MFRILRMRTLLLGIAIVAQARYLENFSGQNGKGLVDAIGPTGTTEINNCGSACADNTSNCSTVPTGLSGVDWTIIATAFFNNNGLSFKHDSPDAFGVIPGRMQVSHPDQEICWVLQRSATCG